jgi:hypothetical protein
MPNYIFGGWSRTTLLPTEEHRSRPFVVGLLRGRLHRMQLPPRILRDHEWGGEHVDSCIVVSKSSFVLFFKKVEKNLPVCIAMFEIGCFDRGKCNAKCNDGCCELHVC